MIEALLAVLMLGLVATAALKLAALSERGLAQVRVREELLEEANRMRIEILKNPTSHSFGMSGDVEWRIEEKVEDLWFEGAEDFAQLNIGDEASADMTKFQNMKQRWRELEIKKNERLITFLLPFDPRASSADAAVSDDA